MGKGIEMLELRVANFGKNYRIMLLGDRSLEVRPGDAKLSPEDLLEMDRSGKVDWIVDDRVREEIYEGFGLRPKRK
jgi:hypothetical protein